MIYSAVPLTQDDVLFVRGAFGFWLLGLCALSLLVFGVVGSWFEMNHWVASVLLALLAIFGIRTIILEWRVMLTTVVESGFLEGDPLRTFLAVVGGTMVTFALAVELSLSPIVAAGIVGVIAGFLSPKLAVPIYCGAFVGMTSPDLFVEYWHGLLAGTIAGAIYLLVQPVFHGIGGKLGTTAFVGAVLTVLITNVGFIPVAIPPVDIILLATVVATIGAVGTYLLHVRGPFSPVFASGIFGVLGGAGLPVVFGDHGVILAACVFAASFAGMSDRKRIPSSLWMGLTGFFVGLLVIYTGPYLGGSGGKLGTIAFAASLAIYGLLISLHLMRVRYPEEFPEYDIT